MSIQNKFEKLGTDHAPGQESRQKSCSVRALRGQALAGPEVDFSHGDVDAHKPTPGALDAFLAGVARGKTQAYTEYRGGLEIRESVAARLASYTGSPVDARDGLIITPGSQGALFLAIAATVSRQDKVAIVEPDYFANRKLVDFFEGEIQGVRLEYRNVASPGAGLDLDQLERAFQSGAKVFVFSNPNNPTGVVYAPNEIAEIAALAGRYGVTVIVDQLYSRLDYGEVPYTHLCATNIDPSNVVTIMGPSKTESLSGYRVGVAFGARKILDRMEKLQAIVSLRAAGYTQAVLQTWFAEPEGWMAERIAAHREIRDQLVGAFRAIDGCFVRVPEAGSYLFPTLPALDLAPLDFVQALRVQANVVVTPGTEFGRHCADSIRLNYSQDRVAAVAAVERLADILERYRA